MNEQNDKMANSSKEPKEGKEKKEKPKSKTAQQVPLEIIKHLLSQTDVAIYSDSI